jgi:DnaJ-class molecular chaperone
MDYYKTLGIDKNASPEEIKRAYRNLAKQYHPDRPDGDDTKFKEINEAYDTLGDPVKRQAYDTPQSKININSQNFEDAFSTFFGTKSQVRKNKDVKIAYDLTLAEVQTGKDVLAMYKLSNGQEVSANVRIHPGIQHGQIIRFRGLGDNTFPQFSRGDLLVLCRVTAHPQYTRDRHHISTTININVFDLILGTTYVITSLTGAPIRVNIPKNTPPGTTLSISGYGLPDPSTNRQGNLYIKLKGIIPNLSDEQLEKVKQINDAISSST